MEKTIIVKWRIMESETIRILKMLPELVEASREEKGNISYTIYQSERNDTRRWADCSTGGKRSAERQHQTDRTQL